MDDVREAYDSMAALYAELFLSGLDDDPYAREWLARFAKLAAQSTGVVADLGCGPGHVTNHLTSLGLTAIGSDLSSGQIDEARNAFPDLTFHVGDQAALDQADSTLGGIVSRYSLIHMEPSLLGGVFAEWLRALEPGAPVLVTFFGSRAAQNHGTPFDHKVATAYELLPATIGELMADAGFTDVEIAAIPIPEGGRPFDQATVLARRP